MTPQGLRACRRQLWLVAWQNPASTVPHSHIGGDLTIGGRVGNPTETSRARRRDGSRFVMGEKLQPSAESNWGLVLRGNLQVDRSRRPLERRRAVQGNLKDLKQSVLKDRHSSWKAYLYPDLSPWNWLAGWSQNDLKGSYALPPGSTGQLEKSRSRIGMWFVNRKAEKKDVNKKRL
jgi:hypothetical protein